MTTPTPSKGPERRKKWKLTVMVHSVEGSSRKEVSALVENALDFCIKETALQFWLKSARVTNADIP